MSELASTKFDTTSTLGAVGANSEDPIGEPLNTVEDLRKGQIKTKKNKAKSPYTILLVGQTGVGKSTVLQFIANVLLGNPVFSYDLTILDRGNEGNGSRGTSQTNAAYLYQLESKNGIKVNILDTPGLADACGLQRDDTHKKSIVTQIQQNVPFVNTVLIVANGTISPNTVDADYTLNSLLALFPKTLARNVALLFTNVAGPFGWDFSLDTWAPALKNSPLYVLDNPVALQDKYGKLKMRPDITSNTLNEMEEVVQASEQKALGVLAKIFDWLDELAPEPTSDIVNLFDKSQNIERQISDILVEIERAGMKMIEIDRIMRAIKFNTAEMNNYANYEFTVDTVTGKQVMVHEEMKKRWQDAKDGKERDEATLKRMNSTREQLEQSIEQQTGDLAELADSWENLSLSGSLSAQMEKAIKLVERQLKCMQEGGVSKEMLNKVDASLQEMKKKLDVLRKANNKSMKSYRSI
ncbi:hypothetical protein DL93DRAFT_2224834 [Clavulina sp. PMI_390]|nr:hypothetical protein DL93DRAFT_2224834 [Clavulina sp. PMI_390]